MSVKRIFSKKKKTESLQHHQQQQGLSSSTTTAALDDDSTSLKSAQSSSASSSLSSKRLMNDEPTFVKVDNAAKSFQYSYNSNTNSLFSSKHTMLTGNSSNPSSYFQGNKKQLSQQQTGPLSEQSGSLSQSQTSSNEKDKTFTSIGRPLRVLNEEEFEEEVEEDRRRPSIHIPTSHRQSYSRRRYTDDAPTSINADRSASISSLPPVSNMSINNLASASNVGNIPANAEMQQMFDFIERQLKMLSTTISNTLIQISQSVLNLTKASISISDSLKSTTAAVSNHRHLAFLPMYQFNTISSVGLRKLIKNILYLIDNLLINEVYDNSKAMLLKNLFDLLNKLKLIDPTTNSSNYSGLSNYISIMSPSLYPIGSTPKEFPNQNKINKIIEKLISKSKEKLFVDQNGSFIAPVLRGFLSEDLSIVTFIFGFPELTKEHYDIIKFFSTTSDDLHFILQRNSIKLASSAAVTPPAPPTPPATTTATTPPTKFKAPFRTLDPTYDYIPISMPIACNNSLTQSGTLGGYIYPKIKSNCKNTNLSKYKDSVFGLTCAHVVLNSSSNNDEENDEYPFVSIPSPVLINLYKNALVNERLKYDVNSEEYKAYNTGIKKLNEFYPVKEVKINGKRFKRNLPVDKFGQIIWGERIINDNRLSDLAIIKINGNSKGRYLNYLGDDLNLNQFDPSLIFSNLKIKKLVNLQNQSKSSPSMVIQEDENGNTLINYSDLEVFKVGSTTNYTKGRLNGLKMIYWSDGALKTSEFIISGSKKNFASGGDSGSFILTKLSNIAKNSAFKLGNTPPTVEPPMLGTASGPSYQQSTSKRSLISTFIDNFIPRLSNTGTTTSTEPTSKEQSGLGVVGMLHSYDGEYKQFGLFTPIHDILNRLEEVTGIEWGVVGCEQGDREEEEDDDDEQDEEGVYGESGDDGRSLSSDGFVDDDEIGVHDGAFTPV